MIWYEMTWHNWKDFLGLNDLSIAEFPEWIISYIKFISFYVYKWYVYQIKRLCKNKCCGTCQYWNFKTSTIKCWGQCLNPKKRKSCYISVRDFPDHLNSVDDFHQFQKDVKEGCEVYFEENFYCSNYSLPL